MGILERLDEIDYRLHLRQRPGAPRRPLTARRIRLIRVVFGLTVVYLLLALAVGFAAGAWAPILPPVAAVFISWLSYDAETRRRIGPWRRKGQVHTIGGDDG